MRWRGAMRLTVMVSVCLLFGSLAGAGQGMTRLTPSVTLWVSWNGEFEGHAADHLQSETLTATSDVTWHAVYAISVPTPLPPPTEANAVAFLSLHLAPDSYVRAVYTECPASCAPTGFLDTGDNAGGIAGGFSNYPDPVGTPDATWSATIDTSFNCATKTDALHEQAWGEVSKPVDLGAIASGPAQGEEWTFSPPDLHGTSLGGACPYNYHWQGTLRISRIKPPAVVPPPRPAPQQTGGGGISPALVKARVKNAAEDDFLDLLPEGIQLCAGGLGPSAILITVAVTGGAAAAGGGLVAAEAIEEAAAEGIAGGVEAGYHGPLCQKTVVRLGLDWSTWKDPPRYDVNVVARTAQEEHATQSASGISCAGRSGAVLRFCAALQSVAAQLLTAADRLAAADQARALTIARLSGAIAKNDSQAADKQANALTGTETTVIADQQAEAAAGAKLAALLRAADITVTLKASETAQAAKDFSAALEQHGVPPSALGTLKPSTTPLDVVETLAHLAAPAAPTSTGPTTPPPAAPAISAVRFGGSPAHPSVTILGSNLGSLPQPSPTGHPAGQGGCPALAGDDGYDYGTSLYLAVPAHNWSAGRYNPAVNETDCIDLVVTKYTTSEIDFHFGPFYTSLYPKFTLTAGTQVQVQVGSASFPATAHYG